MGNEGKVYSYHEFELNSFATKTPALNKELQSF